MSRAIIQLIALCIALTLGVAEAQTPRPPHDDEDDHGSGDRHARQRAEEMRRLAARRRQILDNLEAWKRLSDSEKEQFRQRILDVLRGRAADDGRRRPVDPNEQAEAGEQAGPEQAGPRAGAGSDGRRPGGLHRLLRDERRRLRERHAAMEARFREHARRRRGGMPEGIEELDPVARKRYFYLRRILKGLTKEQRAELGKMADEERQKATKRLLSKQGTRIFAVELERISPAARRRFESLEPRPARRVFRAWLETPSPNLRIFLREHELLLPGDPAGRRRGAHPRGGPPGRGQDRPGGRAGKRDRHDGRAGDQDPDDQDPDDQDPDDQDPDDRGEDGEGADSPGHSAGEPAPAPGGDRPLPRPGAPPAPPGTPRR